MKKSELILHSQSDVDSQSELIKHNNAFILPNGSFYLAKGYTDCNSCHQVESSALAVVRKEIGYDIKKVECENYFQGLGINYRGVVKDKTKWLYYLRSVLIHYYGYAHFSRQEIINSFDDRNRFFDTSEIPYSEYYCREATQLQIETLEKLFELNDDGTMDTRYGSSKDRLQEVLNHDRFHIFDSIKKNK